MQKVLAINGFSATHEEYLPDVDINVSSVHANRWRFFDIVLMQTRHPLDVFATCSRIMKFTLNRAWFKNLFIDRIDQDGIREMGEYYVLLAWLKWNETIEKEANPRLIYRIEDIVEGENKILEVFDALDLPIPERVDYPRKGENPRPERIDLEVLPKELRIRLKNKAEQYGYEI
jgi:hypothetical protein